MPCDDQKQYLQQSDFSLKYTEFFFTEIHLAEYHFSAQLDSLAANTENRTPFFPPAC